jgi:hypothetical protein
MQWLSALDMRNDYWQVELDPDEQGILAVVHGKRPKIWLKTVS